MKANHNTAATLAGVPRLCSKNVRIKCESKSQRGENGCRKESGCVQRTSGLNVKANHNHRLLIDVPIKVVFKERPD